MNRKKIIGTVAGVAAAGVVAGGVSLAAPSFAGSATPSATPSTSSSPATTTAKKHHRRAVRILGIHGSAKVHTKRGYVWVEWQKGTIKSVTSNTMTVVSPDGTTWIWLLGSKTKVRIDGSKSTISNLAANDKVGVAGTDTANRSALRVVVPKPKSS